ncbi:tyrosine-type recombinase/integrase [Haliea sp.]|jgi:integrase|uniref:tyrosine-type recombinase/integrase n=1 Tax=Haliea sp. TaxID=1932666 RepID=UPI000C5CB0A1|nr:tyrosine-type recombinase/integrase [Haliea sp.]HCD55655.1 integrase [Halieaceae bacterium]MAD65346.1 integrase [Haliea sp.]MAD65438.1 integrase [Haliea sp.]MAY91265.1 integrase [Haliea sp.]MBK40754.1 integrase [Haliea sp.]|tara:strand:- start:6222 stop:7526 length:1305 start_codon:yes stop_codon:yes gene_type:complete
MPRLAQELSDAAVRRLKWGRVQSGSNKGAPCTKLHAVGGVGGLYLYCAPPAPGNTTFARSWILKTPIGKDRPELGLGPYPEVTLSMARQKAREFKEQIRQGIDPRVTRKALASALAAEQAKAVTFRTVADRFIVKKSKELKTVKQVQKLTAHLETYAYPILGKLQVSDIERADIIKMLTPIWETKTETATRVRATVERILDMAGAEGLRNGDNPARWRGNLDLSLPLPGKVSKVKHLAAMPVDEVPPFMSELAAKDSTGAMALRFAILTAARSGEIRGAMWSEIDFKAKVWTIPCERMKGGRDHKVPLCREAVDLLKSLPRDHDSNLIFVSPTGKMLSNMTLTKVLKDMGHQVTQHGFRATFRTWAQEHTTYPEEVCELALAHVNSDATRVAYARSELIDKRRKLMADWERFCREGLPATAKMKSIRGRIGCQC